jgi:hypothetical protein
VENLIPDVPPASKDKDNARSRHTRKHVILDPGQTFEDAYSHLKDFDTTLLIDDSESMKPYWDEVRLILQKIAPICIKYDEDGIDVEFVHHIRTRGKIDPHFTGYNNISAATGHPTMHDNVDGIWRTTTPKGRCLLGQRLGNLVGTYKYDLLLEHGKDGQKRPVMRKNYIIISAWEWEDSDSVVKTIKEAMRLVSKLCKSSNLPDDQINFNFFRVGGGNVDDEWSRFIDDDAWKGSNVMDRVKVTTWTGKPGELSEDGLLMALMGAQLQSCERI